MKREIPESVRGALARQTATEEHPSADLLNGFAEQALTAAEKERVTSHLGACADCREIVFLASAAAEEKMVPTITSVHPRWRFWKWAVPAMAAMIIIAAVVLERQQRMARSRSAMSQILAMSRRPAVPEAQPSVTVPENQAVGLQSKDIAKHLEPEGIAKKKLSAPDHARDMDLQLAQQRALSLQGYTSSLQQQQAQLASSLERPPSQAGAASSAPRSEQAKAAAPAPNSPAGQLKALADANQPQVPASSSFAANSADTDRMLEGLSVRREAMSPSRWRVTDDGHLEHTTDAGTWSQVLPEQSVIFRAVNVVGKRVWAGGSDGALFHSTDAGNRWVRVALGAGGQSEHGTVVSIRFDTAMRGTVTTDSGATWSTSDGGQTWIRQ